MSPVGQFAFPKPTPKVRVPKPLRRSPMKRTNRRRRAAAFARNYGERGAAVREMPCLLAATGGCEGPIHAAHARARGMGGTGGDLRELVPLCWHHHGVSHSMAAKDFAALYRIDLRQEAQRIARELDARGYPGREP